MKKIYTVMAVVFSAGILNAQTFWTEDFGQGCNQGQLATAYTGINGAWTMTQTMNNDTYANEWFVSATEAGTGVSQCGDGCLSNTTLANRTLHVGNVAVSLVNLAADNGAAYNTGGVCQSFQICVLTNKRIESPMINCSNKTNITLSFVYMENGQNTLDDASLVYSADGGATWTTLQNLNKTQFGNCSPQGMWTAFSTTLPSSANNNTNVKIGFLWVNNDDGQGTDPSFAVDDIMLSVVISSINEISAEGVNVFNDGNNLVIQSASAVKLNAMYDVVGKQLAVTMHDNKIPVTNLQTGIYFVQIEINGKLVTRKIKI
jgi:hypothetical protein